MYGSMAPVSLTTRTYNALKRNTRRQDYEESQIFFFFTFYVVWPVWTRENLELSGHPFV